MKFQHNSPSRESLSSWKHGSGNLQKKQENSNPIGIKNKKILFLSAFLFVSLSHKFQALADCQALFLTAKGEIRQKIGNDRVSFINEYQDQEGYLRFTEELKKGQNMQYALEVISKTLDEKERKELGWQAFQGTTEEYKELGGKILDTDGNIKPEYIGKEGYALFAKEHYDGDMQKTYINISAVLDKKQKTGLGWQEFQGTIEEYRKLREKILGAEGNIKPEYIGREGYALFAKEHYDGDMQKT
ncbi:MAG: hypothetical protein OXJ52_02675, partial [Oligoflexia bacterium]|nr:hypothetical protein [Oligoflexia bacterium]